MHKPRWCLCNCLHVLHEASNGLFCSEGTLAELHNTCCVHCILASPQNRPYDMTPNYSAAVCACCSYHDSFSCVLSALAHSHSLFNRQLSLAAHMAPYNTALFTTLAHGSQNQLSCICLLLLSAIAFLDTCNCLGQPTLPM